MASETADVIDSIEDSDGDRIWVEVLGPYVYLTQISFGFSCIVRLDAGLRDRFARAWAEAERQAEANSACPIGAVVEGVRAPCQSQRGHDGDHDFIGTPS